MYSKDLVERAVAYKKAGHTLDEVEKAFGMTPTTYYRCKKKLEDGYYNQKKVVRQRKGKIDKEALKQIVAENPDLFQRELAAIFDCKPSSISGMLEKLKLTRKKNSNIR